MYAMTRMPTRVFGVFMSVEPAIAALVGLVVLGEVLAPGQWVAIGCVMLASFGSALTARRG
jgi:inner membrane transporter RhtA